MQNVSKNPAAEWVQKVPSNFLSFLIFLSSLYAPMFSILPYLPSASYMKCFTAAQFQIKCRPKMHDFFFKRLIKYIIKVVASL